MKRNELKFVAVVFTTTLFSSCETTSSYGYYMSAFNDASIAALFELSDQAIAERDFSVYSDLFAPNYILSDRTSGSFATMNRMDYLEMVESLFETAAVLQVATRIMGIDYIEPGRKALVKIQEEEYRIQYGNTQHYTSLHEVEVGYEDGWIFFEKSRRTAMQVIDE